MLFSSRIYKNLVLSVVSLLFTLLLIEIGLRVFYYYHPREFEKSASRPPEPDYSLELVSTQGATLSEPGWLKLVFHPYLTYKNAPDQHNALFNVNSLGFRGEEVSREKGDDVFRIIVLGGSATFGLGSSGDASTMPNQLQRKLNEDHSFSQRVEVINGGVIGYGSFQELVYLETELIDLNPDLIIAYDGYNDFLSATYTTEGCRNPLENPEYREYPAFFAEIESQLIDHAYERNASFPSRAVTLLKPLLLKTSLGKFLRERFWALQSRSAKTNRANANVAKSESPDWDHYELDASCVQQLTGGYQKNLARMARFLGAYNVSLLIAVQPEIGWKGTWSEEEIRFDREFSKRFPWYRRAARIIYPQLIQIAGNVAAEYGVRSVDLRAAFNNRSETIFLDGVHINDRGNEIVAQALSDYLREKINVDKDKM